LPEIVERRLEVDAMYREQLAGMPGITFMPIAPWGGWNGWLTCIVFETAAQRDGAQARLAADDVESRPLWKPMHFQPCFEGRPAVVDGTSERLFRHGLALPSGGAVDAVGLAALVAPATRLGPTVSA